jgi:hypothetical protein
LGGGLDLAVAVSPGQLDPDLGVDSDHDASPPLTRSCGDITECVCMQLPPVWV